jgi:uncharacterized protein involved in outer membrane biogenesis
MRVALFPVPAVAGTDVRIQSASADQAPAVSVRGIRIRPQWRTLVSKPVVVDAVEVEGLTVVVRRDRDGRWILPGPTPTGRSTGGSSVGGVPGLPGGPVSDAVAVRRVRLRDGRLVFVDDVLRTRGGPPEIAAIRGIDADLTQRPDGAGALSLSAFLGKSPLTGSVEMGPQGLLASVQSPSLGNGDVPALFALLGASPPEGLTIAGDTPLDLKMQVARDTGALTAAGRLRAARVQFDTLTVTDVAAPFRVAGNALRVEPLTFAAYGGTERGTLGVQYERAPVQWTLTLRAEGLDVNAFLSANTGTPDRLLGTGQIAARVRGTTETPMARHMNGTVEVALSNGVIKDFALLAAINRALRLTEGDARDTRFERLSATLELARGVMRTGNLSLLAGELTATAAGTIAFDSTIDMTGTALFSREASARMIASIKEISGARNDRGQVEVPFAITGSAENPSFTINAEQILGRAIRKEIERNIRRRFDRFLRRP